MEAISIPVAEPLTFRKLRDLNPNAPAEELAEAFAKLPGELQDEAWSELRLRLELDAWGDGDADA